MIIRVRMTFIIIILSNKKRLSYHQSSFSFRTRHQCMMISTLFVHCLVYENNPQRYGDEVKDRLLDLLEQAFPNPMFVNDLAK